MIKAIKQMLPTAEAIQRLLYPHAEVVIHDVKKNKIAAIYHPFSKRRVGDASLLTPEEISSPEVCIGPYKKTNWDGRKLKCISSIILDDEGKLVGLLCINLDISQLEKFHHFISGFINHDQLIAQPKVLFKDDWQEKLNQCVHAYLNKRSLTLTSLNRTEKKELLLHLHTIGAFTAKNAALYIAQMIGVSRATIYNYLSNSE